jgi:hypothetical protein
MLRRSAAWLKPAGATLLAAKPAASRGFMSRMAVRT